MNESPHDHTAVLVPYLRAVPEWFIIGGLGDGDEAQCAAKRWPGINIIGFDPDERATYFQVYKNGWRRDLWLLWQAALSDVSGQTVTLSLDDGINCASLHPRQIATGKPTCQVQTMTLDDNVFAWNPEINNAVLWLDLEDWELPALRGGERLLKSGRVQVINIEVRKGIEQETQAAAQLLTDAGFVRRNTWFEQWWGHNEIWTPHVHGR